MNKKTRQMVYEKYYGRCAYCGRKIEFKDMQVDHQMPKRRFDNPDDADFEGNLFPACRTCNHYKRAFDLKGFRNQMLGLHERIKKIYIVKVGEAYGMLNAKPFDGKFYFETAQENIKSKNPERRYIAISIKHSINEHPNGKMVLWGQERTRDEEDRCYSGYTRDIKKCEVYTLEEFEKEYKYDWMKCDEPVKPTVDICKRYRDFDTVMVDIDDYREYLMKLGETA